MTSILADSYIATGAAIGFNRGMSPERQAERSEAYSRKEAMDQELRTRKATEPTQQDRQNMADTQSLGLQNALETQKQMMLDNNKMTTFRAYERFDVDGDVRHINTMITELNNKGSKLFGQINRVDKITENDRKMLTDAGYASSYIDMIINDPDVNKSLVIYTLQDGGGKEIGNLDDLKRLTFYTRDYATVNEVQRQENSQELALISSLGYTVGPYTREAFRRTKTELGPNVDPKSPAFQEAYTKHLDELRKTSPLGRNYRPENQTEAEAYGRRVAGENGYYPGDPGYEQALNEGMQQYVTDIRPSSAIKNIRGAEGAVTDLEKEDFWSTDFDTLNPSERGHWEGKIRRIERLGGAELSVADRTSLERIKRLTSMGSAASELTDEQTGIMDSLLRTAKKYVFNEVEGVQAESAYSAFRNLMQHALYGAALTPNEQKNFSKAFGSLMQKRGPVLTQLRVNMQEIKDAYETIQQTNDPMVVAWRTGRDGVELQNVLDALDDRIEMIDDIVNDRPITTVNPRVKPTKKVTLTPEEEADLDRIFKGDGL